MVAVAVFSSCGINKGALDASSGADPNDSSEEDTATAADDDTSGGNTSGGDNAPDLVAGCAWLGGAWKFYDCLNPKGFEIDFTQVPNSCTFQASGANPLLIGSVAVAAGSGFVVSLADSSRCNGYFDGKLLEGSCAGSVPCWFYATKF